MSDVTITVEEGADAGRIVGRIAGLDETAELTWRMLSEERILADHTFVPPAFRGRGVAAMLVEALISTARQRGWQIVPQCSYVAASFKRHPEWADVQG